MKRRSVITGTIFAILSCGCLNGDTDLGPSNKENNGNNTKNETTGPDGQNADSLPENISFAVNVTDAGGNYLAITGGPVNSRLGERGTGEVIISIENTSDRPIMSERNTDLFPPKIVLTPPDDTVEMFFVRDENAPEVDRIDENETVSIGYGVELSHYMLGRTFETTVQIEYRSGNEDHRESFTIEVSAGVPK